MPTTRWATISSAMVSTALPPALIAWIEAWNGNLDRISHAVTEDFVSHTAPLTGGAITSEGREPLRQWIARVHSIMDGFTIKTVVGPIAGDEGMIALRWHATGIYNGSMPGAAREAAGRHVQFYGSDIFRVVDGVIAEYWSSADGWWLLQQLGFGGSRSEDT